MLVSVISVQEEVDEVVAELEPLVKAASVSQSVEVKRKYEAVIVCDKYADFLTHTLPHNKPLFDKLVVVTSFEDAATRKVCEFWNVECLPTDSLKSRHGDFCKGAGIDEGLATLEKDGWVIHLDSDIVLPPLTRTLLDRANLDGRGIYGVDRFMVKGRAAWDSHLNSPNLIHEDWTWVHVGKQDFPVGTRLMIYPAFGYAPIGFFQMWCPSVSGIKDYPTAHTTAARTDVLHALRWPRPMRHLIPEIVAYHLESDDSTHSANWGGRTTSLFI